MKDCVELVNIPLQTEEVCTFIKQGDTIEAYQIDIIETGLDLRTCVIRMQLYNNNNKVMDIVTGSGITALSAITMQIDTYPAAKNNLPEGISIGDLQVTTAAGLTTTYFNIAYTISKQYTRP